MEFRAAYCFIVRRIERRPAGRRTYRLRGARIRGGTQPYRTEAALRFARPLDAARMMSKALAFNKIQCLTVAATRAAMIRFT